MNGLRPHKTPISLNNRLLISAGFALTAFLGLVGTAIDQTFRDNALLSVEKRLQAHVYTLLASTDFNLDNTMLVAENLSDGLFSQPGSGLYARISGDDFAWASQSSLGMTIPEPPRLDQGVTAFQQINRPSNRYFALSLGVVWELPGQTEMPITFSVLENTQAYLNQVGQFRRTLSLWLSASAIALLLLQTLILRWSLNPLRKVSKEITEIELGNHQLIQGNYPIELHGLTENLNTLIQSSHSNMERYRKTLGDLAHSLKTPLAIIRTSLDSDSMNQNPALIQEQVDRMDEIVAYQLNRAASSGQSTLAPPIPTKPIIHTMIRAMEKVFHEKAIHFSSQLADEAVFHGNQGDFMEIVGNLLENACKWCKSSVSIHAELSPGLSKRKPGLRLIVEDDGPGFSSEEIQPLLQRGVRGDQGVAGHGIGLAMVQDILLTYHGRLQLETSQLGGARIIVYLSSPMPDAR